MRADPGSVFSELHMAGFSHGQTFATSRRLVTFGAVRWVWLPLLKTTG